MGDLKGQLTQGAIPDVLRQVYVGRRSGTLHFDSGGRRRSVRFRRGHIINAITSIPEDHLGETMVRHGLITGDELHRATAIVQSHQTRLGEALLQIGAIDPSRLEDGIALHVRDVLLRVFEWNDGEWLFEEEPEDSSIGAPVLKLSAGELILEAVRRLDDVDVIRFQLGDLDRILALSSDPLLRFQKLTLTPADGFVLSRVDGTCSAREVVQMIPLPPEETQRCLFGLICTGIIECLPAPAKRKTATAPSPPAPAPAPAPVPRHEPSRLADTVPTPPPPAATPTAALPRATEPPAPALAPSAASIPAPASPEAQARRKEVLELFESLKTRDHLEIFGIDESATEAQIKEAYFRLAKRFHPDSHHDPTLADLQGQIEAVFIRLGEAYEVLRNPRMRAAYEEATRARRPKPAARAPNPTPPPTFAPLGTQPPRPAPSPAAVTAANTEERSRLAQEAVLKASAFYENEQFWDAIQTLEPAIPRLEGKARSRGRVLLARCFLKNPHWIRRGEELLLDVTHEDPKYAEAWFTLATIYKDRGLKARAASMLHRVLELKPEHEEAERVLTEIEPPPDETPPESGGLLKRLFRRG